MPSSLIICLTGVSLTTLPPTFFTSASSPNPALVITSIQALAVAEDQLVDVLERIDAEAFDQLLPVFVRFEPLLERLGVVHLDEQRRQDLADVDRDDGVGVVGQILIDFGRRGWGKGDRAD